MWRGWEAAIPDYFGVGGKQLVELVARNALADKLASNALASGGGGDYSDDEPRNKEDSPPPFSPPPPMVSPFPPSLFFSCPNGVSVNGRKSTFREGQNEGNGIDFSCSWKGKGIGLRGRE